MGDPSSFLLTTLDDNEAPIQPTLELSGRALPYQGLELEGSMRAEFTWYPGNPVSTVQMLGAQEKSTTIRGMWKDRFLKSVTDDNLSVEPTAIAKFDAQQVTDVLDLANKVDQMRLAGRLLEMKWAGHVRKGILLRFKQNWIRIEDMEWEMEFQWVSRGAKQSPPSLPASAFPNPNSFARNMQDLVDNLRDALTLSTANGFQGGEFQVIERFTANVNAAAEIIDDAALEMENAVANSVQLISLPAEAGQRALAAAESVKAAALSIQNEVESTPPLELIKTSTPEDLDLGDALLADQYSRGIKAAAQALRALAAAQGDDLRAALDVDTLLAAFVARAPTDLRDVSLRYYGTPDEWRRLLDYNSLNTSLLAAGALVLVPKLGAAGSS